MVSSPAASLNANFKDSLMEMSTKSITQEDSVRVKVRRTAIWDDAKIKLNRFTYDHWSKSLRVQFVGESAVDEGGPRREFTALVHNMVMQSKLFEGTPEGKYFSNNFSALKDEDYKLYGKFCVWTLLQGCPAPSFFAKPVVDYIIYGSLEKVEGAIEYIPDSCTQICNFSNRLKNATDDEKLKEICESNIDILIDVGYTKPRLSLEDKEDIIKCLVLKTTIGDSMLAMAQFLDGLSLFGFLDIARKFPEDVRTLFQCQRKAILSAEVIDDMFVPQLSDKGSNNLSYEESILMNFTHFLEDLEAGAVKTTVLCTEDDTLTERMLQLEDFLQFATGSPSIPVLGFHASPSITFNHIDKYRKLSVSTCSLELNFPVNDRLMIYEQFKDEMCECIVSSPGFGQV